MKHILMKAIRWMTLVLFLGMISGTKAAAQGTGFTYQGVLQVNGTPAIGNYDFRFTLYDAVTNGTALTPPLLMPGVAVINGAFTVLLDFQSASIFNGSPRWLAVEVMPHGGTNSFTLLQPLQPITADPYAIMAGNGAGGSVQNPGNFFGNFTGNGSSLSNVVAKTTANLTTNSTLIKSVGSVYSAIDASGYAAASYNSKPTSFYTGPALCINDWSQDSNWGATEAGGANLGGGFSYAGFIARVNALYNSPLYGLGFNTVVIDAGWYGYRDKNGFIHENASMWPDGISNCVRYAHSLGIKVGIWHGPVLAENAGANYSQGFQLAVTNTTNASIIYWSGNTNQSQMYGSSNFSNDQLIINDATTFVNWGIDYTKFELGGPNSALEQHATELFVNTAASLGHPFYVMSSGGNYTNGWMKGLVNAPRCGGYDMPNAYAGTNAVFAQYLNNFLWASKLGYGSGPGSYVSTDIMPYGTTSNLINTMMIMGSMLSSELCFSAANPPPQVNNKNIIALDQDPAAIMAYPVYTNGMATIWQKPLAQPGSFGIMFLNTATNSNASFTVTNLSLFSTAQTNMFCLDLSSNVTFFVSNNWSVTVPPETAYGFKLSPTTALTENPMVSGAGLLAGAKGISSSATNTYTMAPSGFTNASGRMVRVFGFNSTAGYFSNCISGVRFNLPASMPFLILQPNECVVGTSCSASGIVDF